MFEREFYLSTAIRTQKPPTEVMPEVVNAFRRVGGQLSENGTTLTIRDGFAGVQFDFICEGSSFVEVRQRNENQYDVEVRIELKPNQLFWICAIGGFFCLWFLWIANLFYFFVDPNRPYQHALDSLRRELEPTPQGFPTGY
ncbi:hypothetical protein [Blastopirellula marina]|uniref:Uncharacterized protein n=1 Tax=Blastopirellula marina DSM 3645 TaxID=314230 RepID=A3ZT47_9BACT|nr:hypothetical protein [Blastopirellula marina]EAQ80476.1 hypothetical protein DSM3645_11542 [Blastopirellula marina DSM 3645]